MRILVVSDIHSNLDAFKAVLTDAGEYDTVICAGDITGYGAYPSECVDQARVSEFYTVRGNHDDAIGGTASLEDDWFHGEARRVIDIHRSFLVEEEKVPYYLREAAITAHPGVVRGLADMFNLRWKYQSSAID